MSDLRALYQEVILDHYKQPRNFGALDQPVRIAHGSNPLCGDQIKVYVDLDGDLVKQVTFEGHGCAISTAAASLMTEAVSGLARSAVEELSHTFRDLVTSSDGSGDQADAPQDGPDLGKLEVLAGVREYPVRIKCATLAWHALAAAMDAELAGEADQALSTVSTE